MLGQPDTNVPPLMQALYGGDNGKAWENSRVKIYGWLNDGGNLSTSSQKNGLFANLPAAYSTILLRPELRYEHAYDFPVYDGGTRKSQFMFAGDFILFY